ncbi:hypothetical protein ACHAQH_003482 [Verticillium albo-atrum]
MPQTTSRANSVLGIRLENDRTTFAPGDTIVGCVFRGSHIVSTEAVVKVTLSGRVKTKVVAAPSTRGVATVYRGRSILIDQAEHVQTIFQGPLHIPPSASAEEVEREWPFTLAVPMYAANVDDLADEDEPHSSTQVIDRQTLPGTFRMDRAGFGARDEGFVEYTIKAEMVSQKQGYLETTDVTLPITIRTASLEPPIIDFHLKRHRFYGWVSSYCLLPEISRSGPSFSQKARALFGSSKVPVFAGNMEIDTPTIIQLENMSPIPFRLQFLPDPKVLKNSPLDGVPQKIQLQTLNMEIQTVTEISCDDAASPWVAVSPNTIRISVWSCLAFGPGTRPLFIPCAGENAPVDVGQKINLRIGYTGMMGKLYPQGDIHPSFTTRHLKYSHRVNYELRAVIAGEVLKFKWESDVTILPSAGSSEGSMRSGATDWVQPPASTDEDEPPPPPFQETWIRPPFQSETPLTFMER